MQAYSAGIEPTFVHPMAVQVMGELGIDISNRRSKGLEEFADQKFDYVITLCSQANKACPVFFGGTLKLHMDFPNPAAFEGPDEEKVAKYREVRGKIEQEIKKWLKNQ